MKDAVTSSSERPHLVYIAWGFPPAAKSCAYRMLATANSFYRAGWDVTVLTLTEDAWRREHGLDLSLVPLVEPGIEIIRLPLYREDLDTDIRSFSRLRAQRPKEWLKLHRRMDERAFPEPVFGRWREPMTTALLEVHERHPATLVLTSASPYTFFAPARTLNEDHDVPFVLDYRDAWAIDIIGDRPAFAPDDRKGRIEADLMDSMTESWFVNTPIRNAYAELYPSRADDLHVVRNGSDVALGTDRIAFRHPDPHHGLVFGYLGTVTFTPERTRAICLAWRKARESSDVLSRSRLEFRGHIGAGSAKGVNAHARIIHDHRGDGVTYGGPVAKGDTAALYGSWDVLVLALVGGRYVTSGKVYDYISTGLPVVSVHEKDHAATEILAEYPLWTATESLEVDDIAAAFVAAAEQAVTASDETRKEARDYAHRYERYSQIAPAVRRLTERFAPDTAPRPNAPTDETRAAEVTAPHPVSSADVSGERVVFVATTPPGATVVQAMERIRTAGARVSFVTRQIKGYERAAAVADETVLVRSTIGAVPVDKSNPPKRFSPAWVRIVATNLTRKATHKPLSKVRGVAETFWSGVRHNPRATEVLASATVITALDQAAAYTAWRIGRTNTSAALVNGSGPTLDHLDIAG
ncbi:MAG: hypothetical protein WCA30_06185 [Dermatophilaceae bacterium]